MYDKQKNTSICYLLLFVYKNYINIEKVNRGYSMVQDVEYGIYISSERGFFLYFHNCEAQHKIWKNPV